MLAQTLCDAFQRTAQAGGASPALRAFDDGETVTWEQYARRVQAVATGLHALGVRPDDKVALLLRNRPVFNIVDAAVLHLGAVPFSIYHTEPTERMRALLDDSRARVVITEAVFAERVPEGVRVVADAAELEQLQDADFDFERAWRAVTPESVATLVYTSGTTGAPKAVQIPHRAIMHSVAGVDVLAPTSPGQRTVSFLPNAHISDRFICHYSTMAIGGTIICVADHELLWDAIVDTRPTRFHGVPRTFEKLADRAREMSGAPPEEIRDRLGLDQVEWLSVAAAPSSREMLAYHHSLGLPLAELWGMSEFMMALMNPPSRIKLGTVGVPLPSVEAKLGDDGELLLRGPHACANAAFDEDGWLHSGDLASVDEDGYFTIVGRNKEQMINSSGKNLFPAKIEAAIKDGSPLLGHVVTIADRRRYVTALVVLDPEALSAFAGERHLTGTHRELAAHPDVHEEVARAVAAGNEKLSRVEQVRAWTILPEPWATGGDEVTHTSKLRRVAIDAKYADVIEALYT